METSKTLIEVKNVCQEFHLTKGLLQSLRFEKGKLVKEDKVCLLYTSYARYALHL